MSTGLFTKKQLEEQEMKRIREAQEKEDAERRFMREEIERLNEELKLNEETRVGMVLKLRDTNDKRNQAQVSGNSC